MNSEKRICRLCLETNRKRESNKIENSVKNMMDMLLLNLNLELSCEPVICKKCVVNLNKLCEFKSICIENRQLFIKSEENIAVNLGDIELNTNEVARISNMLQVGTICQFCTGKAQIGCGAYLYDMKNILIADIIQKHIPELNLSLEQEVPVCATCLDVLRSFANFTLNCLHIEDKIIQYIDKTDSVQGQIKLFDVQQYTFQSAIKCESNESDANNFEHCENENVIKSEDFVEVDNLVVNLNSEEIEIKSEEIESDSESTYVASAQQGLPSIETSHQVDSATTSSFEMKTEEIYTSIHPDLPEETMFSCDSCSYTTKAKCELRQHIITHHELTEGSTFKCEHCMYITNFKNDLKLHMVTHQVLNEANAYTCQKCSYMTKYKGSLSRHMLIHRDVSDIKLYRCELCTFVAKRRNNLKQHLLTHKKISEVAIFKCQTCPYFTKHKFCLQKHVLTHRDLSEVPVYSCKSCPFKTKFKENLKKHMVKHQDPLFKCKVCSHLAKSKVTFRRHMSSHADLMDKQTYSCEWCSFLTESELCLQRHKLKSHQELLEVKVYKCGTCTFETRLEGVLRRHARTHPRSSEANYV